MKQQKGFTLIELMIAIAILGILAAVSASYLLPHLKRANCADVESVAHEALLKAVQYASDTGGSPSGLNCSSTQIGVDIPSSVKSCVVLGTGNATSPISVNATPSQGCSLGSYYLVNENQSKGAWN